MELHFPKNTAYYLKMFLCCFLSKAPRLIWQSLTYKEDHKTATYLSHFMFRSHFSKNDAKAKTGRNDLYTLLAFPTIFFFAVDKKKNSICEIPLKFVQNPPFFTKHENPVSQTTQNAVKNPLHIHHVSWLFCD